MSEWVVRGVKSEQNWKSDTPDKWDKITSDTEDGVEQDGDYDGVGSDT